MAGARLGHVEPLRPNIVLVMADDQGWGETGYNGHPTVKTPTLDQMAQSGLRFDRFYASAPNCSPSRAGVLTGRIGVRSGVLGPNYSTRPEEISLAAVLRQAGYRTGHFGKWHLGPVKQESPVSPGQMGFDEFLSHDNFFEVDPQLSRNGAPPEVIRGEGSQVVADAAIGFIRKAVGDGKPFFAVVWFASPHEPYVVSASDLAQYAMEPDEQLRRRFAEITALDRAVGALRRSLRELDVAATTLVWYSSDNGIPVRASSFTGGWRDGKGSVYEGGLRVPAIVEWPAVIRTHRATSLPAVGTDIFPTLLDLTGLASPDPARPLDGVSLRPLLSGAAMSERPRPIGFWVRPDDDARYGRWIAAALALGTTPTSQSSAIDFLNFKHPFLTTRDFPGQAAWIDDRFKLVDVNLPRHPARRELYDLAADPGEEHDLAAEKPELLRAMLSQLDLWRRSVERSLKGEDYPRKRQ